MAVVLDTCAWIWYCADADRLSAAAREAIDTERRRQGLLLSVISVWEVAKLVEKGRLTFSRPCRQWIQEALAQDGIQVYPLTPKICMDSAALPGSFHGDPADQIIVATARVESAAVVTSDRRIREYPHVACLW